MQEGVDDPEQYHEREEDGADTGIGGADVNLRQPGISFCQGFGQLVTEAIADAYVEEAEPADDRGHGQPDAIAFLVQVVQGQGYQRELAADADSFYEEGIDDILVGLGCSGVSAEELAFDFCQVEHGC